MSDPEDSCNVLATCSRVDEAAIAILSLLDLPSELILRIASLLEIGDLLALRRIHKCMYSLTQDKLLWRGLLRRLRPPLPRTLRSRHLDSLSYPELEEAVLHSCMVEHQWMKWREHSLTLCAMPEYDWIQLLNTLDDRWVIYISTCGPPIIWDTLEDPPKSFELTSHSFLDETWNATAAVDLYQGDIIIGHQKEEYASRVLRVHLIEPRSDSVGLTDYGVVHHSNPKILGLEPSRGIVITGPSDIDAVEICDWTRERRVIIDKIGEPILGLRLVGDHILCFGSKWIDLRYVPPLPKAGEQLISECDPTSRTFHLQHGGVDFDSASLSEPQPNPKSPNNSRIVYILARRPTVGLFYFRITVYNPDYSPSGPRARIEVDLVGAYELRQPQEGIECVFELSLGPEGKRGIWIERTSDFEKFIAAASFDQNCPGCISVESGDDLAELCENAPWIEMSNVFELNQDLHDAIIRCAFSESTGKIVLGTRDNRVILL